MIFHELRRMFSWRPVSVTIFFIVPLLILICFVPPVVSPITVSTDSGAAFERFNSLPELFVGLSRTADENNTYQAQLLNAWVAFGGQTDDIEGDIPGAYLPFYRYTGEDYYEMLGLFQTAQTAFMNYYDLYEQYMMPEPKIFIPEAQFNALTSGTEQLYGYFGTSYTNMEELNNARGEMNRIRESTPFRQIFASAQMMYLTESQAADLTDKWTEYDYHRQQLGGSVSNEYIVDFCGMAYTYLTWQMNQYIGSNANFNISKYYGFSSYTKEIQKSEAIRIKYLLDNNKFNLDYSAAPIGLSPINTFSVMNKRMGTSLADFIYDANEIIFPALVLFTLAMTIFSIFTDINGGTVVGAVASQYSRRKIIWSKLAACALCITIISVFFLVMFSILGTIILGSSAIPPAAIVVVFGRYAVQMFPAMILFLHLLTMLIKLFFIIAIVGFLSVWLKSKYLLVSLGFILSAGFVIADIFLGQFALYTILFWPIIVLSIGGFLFGTDKLFVKKEF